ncbi:hypothetical protein EDB87DRAFT_1574677 [Lactarius vividus]|nr:hypothetical protein EDB87DRAFT_1574677 [Lactarius vividus]
MDLDPPPQLIMASCQQGRSQEGWDSQADCLVWAMFQKEAKEVQVGFAIAEAADIYYAHCPHTPPHLSNLDVLSGCEARAHLFLQEGSEDFDGPALGNFALFTGPTLCLSASSCQVTATILDRPFKAWCYGAMFCNPPPLLPFEDHDASLLLPSSWSCSGGGQEEGRAGQEWQAYVPFKTWWDILFIVSIKATPIRRTSSPGWMIQSDAL